MIPHPQASKLLDVETSLALIGNPDALECFEMMGEEMKLAFVQRMKRQVAEVRAFLEESVNAQ